MTELKLDMHAHVCVYNMKEGQKRRKNIITESLVFEKEPKKSGYSPAWAACKEGDKYHWQWYTHTFFLFVIKILFPVNMVCGLDFVCTGVCV